MNHPYATFSHIALHFLSYVPYRNIYAILQLLLAKGCVIIDGPAVEHDPAPMRVWF